MLKHRGFPGRCRVQIFNLPFVDPTPKATPLKRLSAIETVDPRIGGPIRACARF